MNTPSESLDQAKDMGPNNRRRRVLVAGSALSVLASLKSGSALAEGVCASPSSFTSITLNPATSHRPRQLPTCHSHGYWKNRYTGDMTLSQAGFCCSGSSQLAALNITCDSKLKDILWLGGGGGSGAFARDLVSAYLDASNGFAQDQFTTADVQKMWGLVFCGQAYVVNGTAWNQVTVRGFLDVLVGNVENWP